jgi:F-type H+-transporting ATPase subunit a
MATNPMHQFEVYRIGPEIKLGAIDISFTNASLFMVVSSLAILLIFNLGSKKNSLLPNKVQLLAELSYTFVSKMISDTAGSKAKPYFAFIFSLFMFVLFCNMFGMIPYAFTVTSHIIVTFILASFIFVGVTIIGFMKHGLGYLKLFVPSGVPAVLLPLIVVIEIISYLSRPVSLSVRLFANMMAGHTMMKVFGGFVISLGIVGGWLPLSFSVALTGLEILVAFLQAAIALAGAGVGIGIIFGNYLSGAMRNPSAAQKQFPNLLLGFALAEATGLFGLVVALIILFAF